MLDNRICADLCRFGAEGGNLTDILLALGIPGIVRGLHAYSDSGAIAEQFAEANCQTRRQKGGLLLISRER
jgi:hypothetical protein